MLVSVVRLGELPLALAGLSLARLGMGMGW
jgi:hypothetical protein